MNSDPVQTYDELSLALGLKAPMMVSLVGAGGKTSAIMSLARELSAKGSSVLVSTTTKMYVPDLPLVLYSDPEELVSELAPRMRPGIVLAAGAAILELEPRHKLQGLPPQTLDRLYEAGTADYILVEADGSRRLPIKAPRAGEPVTPRASGLVLGLLGLSALGRAADDSTVFGLSQYLEITQARQGGPIHPAQLKLLLQDPRGIFKGCPPGARRAVLLNQLDLLPVAQWDELFAIFRHTGCETLAGSLHKAYFHLIDPGRQHA